MQLVLVDSNFIRAVMSLLQTEERLPGVEIVRQHHNFSATLRSQSISYQWIRCSREKKLEGEKRWEFFSLNVHRCSRFRGSYSVFDMFCGNFFFRSELYSLFTPHYDSTSGKTRCLKRD
ncbi:hypothetical protein NPIL_509551 [Nephila pilipes]|uniref:Uncharacterized protein n=1 Tax=Nephila pilipes TaxID=299642 RepID=A0A8X6N536_NEPPI|nr:hypothetical protein NPIL_509551 [Nephila pilipes]